MTVTTSYPGVYVQELPNLTHSITAAPTSVAVFVGYSHPFLTPSANYGAAIQLFSFADYQNNFGGLFSSPWQPDNLGQAVSQFFANGGGTCYVVGLQAKEYYTDANGTAATSGGNPVEVAPAEAEVTAGAGTITFTAKQPVGLQASGSTPALGPGMQVAISNLQSSNTVADIIIAYGSTVETYRGVKIAGVATSLAASQLVAVALSSTAPTEFPTTGSPFPLTLADPAPEAGWTVINPGDYGAVFEDYAPLDKVSVFNLLATPGMSNFAVTSAAAAYCERKRAFYIGETPSPDTSGWDANSMVGSIGNLSSEFPVSINAALYYPWVKTIDPLTGAASTAPPSGFVAGVYAREDSNFGVWKSPAGIETVLNGTTGVVPSGAMTDPQQGVFNQNALNCLRQFPSIGTVVFGARTTAGADANTGQQQWKYVAVRRMALFIEQTLYANLTWAVFEPNAQPLWDALTQEVNAFMLTLFRQNAFAGTTPSTSFVVQCDASTTTPTDVAGGRVNILVGFAPLLPAEFVIVQIAQLAGQAQS